jgi:hypothetical protein
MDIRTKIIRNITDQLLIAMQADELRTKLEEKGRDMTATIGRMSILSEMFEEETGKNLQAALNTDPQWKGVIDDAQKKAQALFAASSRPSVAAALDQVNAVATKPPVLTAKPTKVAEPHAKAPPVIELGEDIEFQSEEDALVSAQESAQVNKASNKAQLNDRNNPIKIVIDDNPHEPPPGTRRTEIGDDDDGG